MKFCQWICAIYVFLKLKMKKKLTNVILPYITILHNMLSIQLICQTEKKSINLHQENDVDSEQIIVLQWHTNCLGSVQGNLK